MVFLRRGLQYLIALILLSTALGKLLDVPGFVSVLETYQSFPQIALYPIAVAFVLFELHLAEWLFWGKYLDLAALVATLLHSTFVVWVVVTLLRGIEVPNCGCFGVFLARPLTWGTMVEDLVMVGASFGLYLLARKDPQCSKYFAS